MVPSETAAVPWHLLRKDMEFTFDNLDPKIKKSLERMGFEKPTPIQEKALPVALEGKDLVGQAQTGTGKTAAFGIPLVNGISSRERGVKAIVLTPTRELAIQVAHEISLIGKDKHISAYPIYGGVSIEKQANILKKGMAQIVVGTPGRVKDLIERRILKLDKIRFAVLDEADQMLDMGFIEDIEAILSKTPKDKQTMLFSATMPSGILKLIRSYLKTGYQIVKVGKTVITPQVNQKLVFVRRNEKFKALLKILRDIGNASVLIFVKTKKDAAEIGAKLVQKGINAKAIHGDLTQRQREYVMNAFRHGKVKVLVATDVAARGIDIKNIGFVINYELPENPDIYIHRIGRTGRAGTEGTAISLVSDAEKRRMYRIKSLKNIRGEKFVANNEKEIESEVLSVKPERIPPKVRKIARELISKRTASDLVEILLYKLLGNE